MRKISVYFLALTLFASLEACAQSKKTASGGNSGILVLQATQQTTNPGRQESKPYTEYRFKVVWKSQSAPTAIHWRPDAGSWEEIKVTKPERRPGIGPTDFMIIDRNINLNNIRYGDTLSFDVPRHAHDHEPMPAAVKGLPIKSLYYQTAASGLKWMYTKVNIRLLPDINMP